jgi:hypothetical protein
LDSVNCRRVGAEIDWDQPTGTGTCTGSLRPDPFGGSSFTAVPNCQRPARMRYKDEISNDWPSDKTFGSAFLSDWQLLFNARPATSTTSRRVLLIQPAHLPTHRCPLKTLGFRPIEGAETDSQEEEMGHSRGLRTKTFSSYGSKVPKILARQSATSNGVNDVCQSR